MSTMSGKNSPEGEEGAGRMKSESWGQSNAVGEVRRGQVILAAYLIVTLELTFLFMQFGVMPYLAKNLGLDSVGFGYLQTIFGVLQLVGGPVFGRFADQFGNRAALTLSCASASAFFLLLSISTSIPILFLSRLPSVFMHGLPGAQKVITDLTAPSERAAALGRLGLCFGVGIIIGSALGGVISTKFGVFVPMYLGLVGSLINTIISIVWIPSPAKPKSEQRKTENSSVFSVREILRVMKFPGVMEIFLVKVLSGLPIVRTWHWLRSMMPAGPAPTTRERTGTSMDGWLAQSLFLIMFSIISIEFFGLEAVESGYLMSYFGVLQMVVQGLVIGKLTSLCTEQTLLKLSIFIFAGVGLGMALMKTIWHYCIIVVPLVFAFNVQGTITDSILTKAVPSSDTGKAHHNHQTCLFPFFGSIR
ncbi:solute carrier family 22 member 18 isoform X2 [Centrocercus urophasianus]|uniref:solute carrier family 22 member 18 isoform X2 n=1 Tax=Centrocercus urophasianus TaxID=9002 RepID=UPI001C65202D|nr:solute carrier family 22 member 18 isoform X2 [Centrocercus urophasianus]